MNLGNLVRSAHAFGASFVFLVNADYAVRARPLGHLPGRVPAAGLRLRLGRRSCSCRAAAGWSAASWSTTRSSCRAFATRTTPPMCSAPSAARCRRRCSRAATMWCGSRRGSASILRWPARSSCTTGCSARPVRAAAAACRRARASRCRRMCTAPSSASAGGRRPVSSRCERRPCGARAVRCFRSPWRATMVAGPATMTFAAARIPMRHWLRWALAFTMLAMAGGIAGLGPDAEIDRQPTATGRSTRSPTAAAGSAIWRASPASQSGNYSRRDNPAVLVVRLPGKTERVGHACTRATRTSKDSKVKVTIDGPRVRAVHGR